MYQKYVKRLLDIVLALCCIIVSGPVLLVTALLVRVKLGSPIIFRQERPGKDNKVFTLYKFRTMTDAKDSDGNLLPDSQRLPGFGKLLRSTSLDELPEFFNILFGHMSFVGPRPLLTQYVQLYNPRQSRRHEVLPGLTGLAQVNGRNAISWEEKFEFDIEYVENLSFFLDLKIVCKTFQKVLQRAGISAYESVTMESFQGTGKRKFSKYRNDRESRILFTSVGNKVELIETFLYAAGNANQKIYLVGADASPEAPALYKCHSHYQTKKPGEEGYIRQLLSICRKERIDLLIPSDEKEIFLLSERRRQFEDAGTRILLSKEEHVCFCSNKLWTYRFFRQSGVDCPQNVSSVEEYQQGYPCLLEILDPEGNITSTRKVKEKEELVYLAAQYEHISIRPFLEGVIYEIDVFCDFEGNPVFITPRAKEQAYGNEHSRFRVVKSAEITEEVKKIIAAFRPSGPLTIKMLCQETTGKRYYLRMEPRFDQNVTVSIKAGADSPMAILKMLHGEEQKFQPNAADDNILFGRIEKSICLNTKKEDVKKIETFSELECLPEDMEAVIFDLDDTLYSEKEYHRSSYRAVAEYLSQIPQCFNKLCTAFEKGQNPLETVLKENGMYSKEQFEKCRKVMEEHVPELQLYEGVRELFFELHKQKKSIGILTDGNPYVQRAKIKSLGLDYLADEILYTDELAGNGDAKEFRRPNDLAFLIMKKRFHVPCRNMAFVGDDRGLDFIAPEKLGMECYWKKNEDGMYE